MKIEKFTALYSPLDIEISQEISGQYEDLSYRDEDCHVIAGLKDNRISGFWRPMIAVGDNKSLKMHIERLYDICQDIFYMDFLIDGKLSVISQFLLRHGYKARPYYTQVIDLTKPCSELHSDLRKSYKSLVNKRENLLRGSVSDFRILHEKDRGIKRSDKAWDIQEKMKENGRAFCILDDWSDTQAEIMIYYNDIWAYYASAASKSGANSHACLWEGIKTCMAMGCKYFEMGEQVFSVGAKMLGGADKPKFANKKDVDISLFKRGFGGESKVRLILEK